MKIKLQAASDAIAGAGDEISYVMDTKTGEILLYSEDGAVDSDDFDISDERYVNIPGQWERNDYRIMQDFIASLPTEDARDQLAAAIHGRGAFRMFRATVERLGLLPQWYNYQDAAYRQMAIDWCQAHGLTYE